MEQQKITQNTTIPNTIRKTTSEALLLFYRDLIVNSTSFWLKDECFNYFSLFKHIRNISNK